jgi:hypothetical protein
MTMMHSNNVINTGVNAIIMTEIISAIQEEKRVIDYYNYARNLALKIAQEQIQYQPQGMISSDIKHTLINDFGIAETNSDFISLVIKYILMNSDIDTIQFGEDIGSFKFTWKNREPSNSNGVAAAGTTCNKKKTRLDK